MTRAHVTLVVSLRPRRRFSGVYRVATGRVLAGANVYLVRSVPGWVLIDTAWPHRGRLITAAAESVFGAGGEPTMMGLGFFRRSVELAELYRRPGQITNTIQTSGTLFDGRLGRVLR
jgi:hypothetical protein